MNLTSKLRNNFDKATRPSTTQPSIGYYPIKARGSTLCLDEIIGHHCELN